MDRFEKELFEEIITESQLMRICEDDVADYINTEYIEYKIINIPTVVGVDRNNKIVSIHKQEEMFGKEYLQEGGNMAKERQRYKDSKNPNDWLDSAEEDLASAGASHYFEQYKQSCILSYQAAEKGLKAYLIYAQGYAPETHSLNHLIKLCYNLEEEFDYYVGAHKFYEDYYIPLKYPTNNKPQVNRELAMEMMKVSANMCGLVDKLINK